MGENKTTKNIGRYSTQLINQSGAEKSVVLQDGTFKNDYTYAQGREFFPSSDSVNLSDAVLEKGSANTNIFSAVFGYFQSRGSSEPSARTMALAAIDTAKILKISPISILDYNSSNASIKSEYLTYFNRVRSLSSPQDKFSNSVNSDSLMARKIRA